MSGESIGGRSAGAALDALSHDRWRVLNDVPWPGRRPATIDHVVVGRAGVFVVDVRSWPGEVRVRDGVLRQDRYSRQGAVTQVAEAARVVGSGVRSARCPVQGVLCLERDEAIVIESDGVLVCSTASLADVLESRPAVLADLQVERIATDLSGRGLPVPAASPPRPHSSHRGVAYLSGALAALVVALLLVARPDVVADAVEGLARWVADQVQD